MKKYFKSKVFLLAAFLMLLCNVNAQVGVNTLDAFSNSELDIRNEVVGNDTIAKGVLIPRMTEAQRTLIDVKSAESNSLLIYNTSEDCFNYYDKLNNDWKSLCGTLGKASFSPLTCDDISIFGTYVESVSGTLMNYVALKTTVLEPGAYSINITTNNGYYFVLSGTALVAGELILNIPCFGKPIKAGTDDLVIKGISLNDKDCKPQIVVNSEIANYSINCSSVVVVGNYSKGTLYNRICHIFCYRIGIITALSSSNLRPCSSIFRTKNSIKNKIHLICITVRSSIYNTPSSTNISRKSFA